MVAVAPDILAPVRAAPLTVFVPMAPILALLTWWTVDGGGYDATKWLPGTVVAVALLALVLVLRPRDAPGLPRPLALALAGLGGLVAFSYLSIAWADAPGAALQGSHRVLLYAAIAATSALLPWTAGTVTVAVGWLVGAAGLAAAVALIKLHGATSTVGLFVDARMSFPTGYQNATAALFTMAGVPAVMLASRRELPLLLRPALLAIATACECLALTSVSRGWLFTLPIVVLVTIVIVPRRVRFVVFAVPVAIAVAAISHPALQAYRAGRGRELSVAAPDVARAAHHLPGPILIATLAVAAVGLALAVADRAVTLGEARERALRRAALAGAVVALLAGAGVGVAVAHDPLGAPSRAWKSFTRKDAKPDQPGKSRFSELGSSRYDFWRVALDEFERHPIAGIGQDNFAQPYLALRHSSQEPRWTHSIELRALTHTGIVGAALLLAALGGLAWGVATARRNGPAAGQAAVIAALPGVVWLVHGSVDWLWEFPALSGWALVLAAGGAALAGRPAGRAAPPAPASGDADGDQPNASGGRRRVLGAAVGLVALALMVLPALDWVAERDVELAQRQWPRDPFAALHRLDRAARLDPSARPRLVQGLIAAQIGDEPRAVAAFRAAHEREPHDWYALFNLGLLASQMKTTDTARTFLRDALRQDPRDTVVREAVKRVDTSHPMTFEEAASLLRQRSNRRFGPH